MNINETLDKISGMKLEHKKARINNFEINYVVAGSGEPLVLIHGINIGAGQWHKNIRGLSERFKVFCIDLPGAGGSEKVDFSNFDIQNGFVKTTKDFLLHIVEQFGFKSVRLLGHSLGGWIALKIALDAQKNQSAIKIEKLILVDTMGFTDFVPWSYRPLAFKFLAKFFSKTVMKPNKRNMQKFLSTAMKDKTKTDSGFVDYFCSTVGNDERAHPFLLIHRLCDGFRVQKEIVILEELSELTTPTLIIFGENDPLIPFLKVKENFKRIKTARLEVFNNTGHVPFLEHPEKFNALVCNF